MRFIMAGLTRMIRQSSSIIALCLILSACAVFTPAVKPGEVIFQDDFSRVDSVWDRYADDLYRADYHNGTYRIQVDSTQMTAWSRPHLDLSNVLIRVDGTRIAGPMDNVYGVICRYSDSENFYFFLISSDGYAGIGRYISGEKELLNHETLLPTDAIATAEESNLIQAACVDNDLTLWINGEKVAEATTAELSRGDVGLIVGTYEAGGVVIQFDNFATLMP